MSTENISEDDLFGPGEFPLYPEQTVEQVVQEELDIFLPLFWRLGVKVLPFGEAELVDAGTTREVFCEIRPSSPTPLPDSPDDEL